MTSLVANTAEEKRTPIVCALCHKPNVTPESHCFGCGELICDDCDRSPPLGKHAKEAHIYDEESFDRMGHMKRWPR